MARLERGKFLPGFQEHRAPTPVQLHASDLKKNGDVFSKEWITIQKPFSPLTDDPNIEKAVSDELKENEHKNDLSTPIGKVSRDFPMLYGKTFGDWLSLNIRLGRGRILQYEKLYESEISSDINKTYGKRIREYTHVQVVDKDRSGTKGGVENYTTIKVSHDEFNPRMFGKEGIVVGGERTDTGTYIDFDIVFATNLSDHSPEALDTLRRLHEATKDGGLLFANGINVEPGFAKKLIDRWKQLGYSFVHELKTDNTGQNKLSIAMRKTTELLAVAQPTK